MFNRFLEISPIKRQSLISVTSSIIVTLLGFISTMYFSHTLGKDLMGIYYLFIAYYGIFNMIGEFGFGQAAIKRISESSEKNEYLSAYVLLRSLCLIVSTLLFLLVSPYLIDLKDVNLTFAIVVVLFVAAFSNIVTMGIRGLDHIGIYSIASSLSEIFRISLQVILVLLGFSIFGLCGGCIVGVFMFGILCLKYFTFKPAKFGLRHIKSLFVYGFWIFLISAGSTIFTYADTIFVGYFMTAGDVGVYRTAFQFTALAAFFALAFQQTLTPKISNWSANGQWEKIPSPVSRSITISLILAIPVFIGSLMLADKLLYFFYGADFAAGATACMILFLVQIISIFVTLLGVALTASDHARQSFYATAISAILNVILNCLLIPTLGINGAAVATLISYSINAILIAYFLRRYIIIKIEFRAIFHIIISAVVMAFFVLLYKHFIPLDNVILTIIPVVVGACLYIFLLLKIDSGIRDDIADVVTTLGLPWPKWLWG